jgi:hypothetical protein
VKHSADCSSVNSNGKSQSFSRADVCFVGRIHLQEIDWAIQQLHEEDMMSQRNVLETAHVDKNIDLISGKMRNDFAAGYATKWPIDTVAMQLIRSLSTTLLAGEQSSALARGTIPATTLCDMPKPTINRATAGSCEIRSIVGSGNNLKLLSSAKNGSIRFQS